MRNEDEKKNVGGRGHDIVHVHVWGGKQLSRCLGLGVEELVLFLTRWFCPIIPRQWLDSVLFWVAFANPCGPDSFFGIDYSTDAVGLLCFGI